MCNLHKKSFGLYDTKRQRPISQVNLLKDHRKEFLLNTILAKVRILLIKYIAFHHFGKHSDDIQELFSFAVLDLMDFLVYLVMVKALDPQTRYLKEPVRLFLNNSQR